MEQIGPYKILKRLGGGGFGEVWLGESSLRQVAIKVFNPKDENLIAFATSSDTEGLDVLRARFLNEAKILADLEANPHIVSEYEFGELDDGSPYYVMAYLPRSLTELLGKDVYDAAAVAELPEAERPRSLPLADALSYLDQLLVGLSAAHKLGLVHRDIKPSNVMLGDDNQIRLVDFGIAKAPDGQHSTVSQLGMGSRNYMAPEQRESAKHVDARADVYAVGALAYRMITGRLPTGRFSDPNVYATSLSQGLSNLILDCLQEDKAQRPVDANALLSQYRAARGEQISDGNETGTWVGGAGETSIRDELKPLRDQIKQQLESSADIPDAKYQQFVAVASVVDIDEAGLASLISGVEGELGPKLKLKQNFLVLLDKTLAAGPLQDAGRETLYAASAPTGWTKADVDGLIAARQPEAKAPDVFEERAEEKAGEKTEEPEPMKSAPTRQPVPAPVEDTPVKKSSGGWIVMLLIVLAVGAGFYFYTDYQAQIAQEAQQTAARQALIRQDNQAFTQAKTTNTAAAYETYLAGSNLSVSNRTEAQKLLADLEATAKAKTERDRQARIAQANAEQAQRDKLAMAKAEKARQEQLAADKRAAAALAAKSKPGTEGKDCSDCPTLVTIPAGRFRMGDLSGVGAADEKPVHTVTVPSFLLGKYEVTFAEYDVFARATNRSLPEDQGWGRGNRPVINVSWDDAQAYVAWLSKKTNKRYRLPTESEWEYAARGGTETKYSWGNDIGRNQANCNGCGSQWDGKQTAPIGSFGSNPFGLHDLHGNLWEWTQDCYQDSYTGVPVDGQAAGGRSCERRVLRGGSWFSGPALLRSANRGRSSPSWRYFDIGFRVAQDL